MVVSHILRAVKGRCTTFLGGLSEDYRPERAAIVPHPQDGSVYLLILPIEGIFDFRLKLWVLERLNIVTVQI